MIHGVSAAGLARQAAQICRPMPTSSWPTTSRAFDKHSNALWPPSRRSLFTSHTLSRPQRYDYDPRRRDSIPTTARVTGTSTPTPGVNDPHAQLARAKPILQWITNPNSPSSSETNSRWSSIRRRFPNRRQVILLSILSATIFYVSNLQTVPVSGRRRFNCFSDGMVQRLCAMQYERTLADLRSQGVRIFDERDRRTRLVKRVMQRLIPVISADGADGLGSMDETQWEVHVVDQPQVANAVVLPGGKVFVFSGILSMTRSEGELAAVLGHEMAHNLAQHVGERFSQSLGPNVLLGSLFVLSLAFPVALLAQQYIVGGLLDLMFERPMSRLQESEADYIGVMMMAEACYDPREAVRFWQRMDASTRTEQPEFMSTHPSNKTRIEKILQELPAAMEKREASDCQGTQGFANRFRSAMAGGYTMST